MKQIQKLIFEEKFDLILKYLDSDNKRLRKKYIISLNQNVSDSEQDLPKSFQKQLYKMVLSETDYEIKSNLIEILKMTDDNYVENLGKEISKNQNSSEYPKYLEKWIESNYTEMKITALNYLSENHEDHIHNYAEDLCTSSNLLIRKEAIMLCGELGYNKFVDNLSKSLDHTNTEIREQTIDALVEIRSDSAFKKLLPIAVNKKHTEYAQVLQNIGKFGKIDCLGSIIYAYNDGDENIRKIAVRASVDLMINSSLHKINQTVASYFDKSSIKYIRDLLDFDDYKVRRNAIWLIGELEPKYSEDLIEDLVRFIDVDDLVTENICKSILSSLDENEYVLPKLEEYIRKNKVKSRSLSHADYIRNKVVEDKSTQKIKRQNVNYISINEPEDYTNRK